MARATELKTKLQELSKVIVEDEDCTFETIDQAQETLAALKKYQSLASPRRRSHIPKFGSWERDNVRYTTYFENARVAKAAEKMNPNDPVALVDGLEDQDSIQDFLDLNLNKNKSVEERQGEGNLRYNSQGRNTRNRQNSIQSSLDLDFNKNKSVEKDRGEGYKEHNPLGKNTRNYQQSGSNKSIASKSSSDESNSSHFLQQSSQKRRVKSNEEKGSDEGRRNSFSQWAHGLSRPSSGSEYRQGGIPVPKFGDWDERDPSSGEGFTAIFEKLKEEKRIIASGEVRAVPHSDLDNQTNNKPSSCKSMMFCCLIPGRSGRY